MKGDGVQGFEFPFELLLSGEMGWDVLCPEGGLSLFHLSGRGCALC